MGKQGHLKTISVLVSDVAVNILEAGTAPTAKISITVLKNTGGSKTTT